MVELVAEAGNGKATIEAELMQTLRSQLTSIFGRLEELLARPEMAGFLKGVPPKRGVPVLWSMITGLSHIALPSPRSREGGFDFSQTLDDMMTIITK
jgi:hypothetical protein